MSSREGEAQTKDTSEGDSTTKVDFNIKSTGEDDIDEGEVIDEEDEYAEEAEPILAYTRMKNDVLDILQQDSVSCIKAGHRVTTLEFKS
jgi:hypothetical protein